VPIAVVAATRASSPSEPSWIAASSGRSASGCMKRPSTSAALRADTESPAVSRANMSSRTFDRTARLASHHAATSRTRASS
jgi:hypothetical protein